MAFQSKGITCRGWFYVPDGLRQGQKAPTIVMTHGFSAVKEMYLQHFADRFAANGLACLVFDYRYLGASDGEPRGQIFPWEQQENPAMRPGAAMLGSTVAALPGSLAPTILNSTSHISALAIRVRCCRQRAKSPELRAAMSLSRLWQRQGKRDEARQLLTEI
jgi:hypothetical protein